VPIVVHLHGGHNAEESDGFTEAWYLPAARNLPAGFAPAGTLYDAFAAKFAERWGQAWQP
jgi:spore coat protein A